MHTLRDLDVEGKKVLVRADLDIIDLSGKPSRRFFVLIPTLKYLVEQGCKIILLSYRGRPGGKVDESLSFKPVAEKLEEILQKEWGKKLFDKADIQVMENLRFDPGEDSNNPEYAKHLASHGDIFVNESFGTLHRRNASVVGLPKLLPSAVGFHLQKELLNLGKVLKNPKSPVIFLLGGFKKDKLDHLAGINKIADKVLVGGRLPFYLDSDAHGEHDDLASSEIIEESKNKKVVVAKLIQDKEDITINSAEKFIEEIEKAGTIVVSGPMGKFEDKGHMQGTKAVFEAVANSSAFKVAGGGDTEMAIKSLSLSEKFDWISVGGGAMLEYIVKGSLPGLEAIKSK